MYAVEKKKKKKRKREERKERKIKKEKKKILSHGLKTGRCQGTYSYPYSIAITIRSGLATRSAMHASWPDHIERLSCIPPYGNDPIGAISKFKTISCI
jgi:hypothetical protein